MKYESLNSPRIHFNWGFHDGQHDAERGTMRTYGKHLFCLPKHDPAYCDGYKAGHLEYRLAGKRNETSDAAWSDHRGISQEVA